MRHHGDDVYMTS